MLPTGDVYILYTSNVPTSDENYDDFVDRLPADEEYHLQLVDLSLVEMVSDSDESEASCVIC